MGKGEGDSMGGVVAFPSPHSINRLDLLECTYEHMNIHSYVPRLRELCKNYANVREPLYIYVRIIVRSRLTP